MPLGLSTRRRWNVTVALLALAVVHPRALAAEPAAVGVLILRNGNVLQGAVRSVDGFYFVEQAGASLQVPAEQVEMACSSLAEAYERRRMDRVGTSADGHLELARWCLKNGLLDQAAREVLDARTIDPGHPALPMLDSAIRLGLELKASREAKRVETAAADSAVQDVNPPVARSLIEPSGEAQTQFVRSIQPMLVQSCVTGGCHQPGSAQQMQLDRWALQGNGNPELIRRNLDAVLAQINAADPPSSAVMIRSRQSHGGGGYGRSKPLASYQAAILLEWLSAAAGVRPEDSSTETSVEPSAAIEEQSSLAPEGSAVINTKLPAATASPFKPRDAFDPEIFNRRMAAKAPSLAGEDPLQRSGGAATDAEIEAALEALEQSAATAPPASE